MAAIACQAAKEYQPKKDKQELRAARQEASMRTPRQNAAASSDSVAAAQPTRVVLVGGRPRQSEACVFQQHRVELIITCFHKSLEEEQGHSFAGACHLSLRWSMPHPGRNLGESFDSACSTPWLRACLRMSASSIFLRASGE